MNSRQTLIHRTVEQALQDGAPLKPKNIRELREKSEGSIRRAKLSFWLAIAVFNLLIWAPAPESLDRSVIIIVGVICIAFAMIYPILGIRKHQKNLFFLQDCSPGPKKRKASDEGRAYIEEVKEQGRSFIGAEVEILEGRELEEAEL